MDMETVEVVKDLPVPLTIEEEREYTEKAIVARRKIRGLEDEKKEVAKDYKERIDAETVRLDDALSVLDEGSLVKQVKCLESWSFSTSRITVVRQDTGELVGERVMTPAERQKMLDFREANPVEPQESLWERNQRLIEEEWAAWCEQEEDEDEFKEAA